jgi:hypothetical protein
MRNAQKADEEEEDRSEGETLINRQASREEEDGDQEQVKMRVEEGQTYCVPMRRVRRFEGPKDRRLFLHSDQWSRWRFLDLYQMRNCFGV